MAYESKDESDNSLMHNLGMHNDSDNNPFEYHVPDWFFFAMSIVCPIVMLCGVFTNILAFVVLVRSRLWLKHEGYVYLAAICCANVGILLMCTSSFWMTFVYGNGRYYPPNTSVFMCKFWHFLTALITAPGWLSVALVFNVYLRIYTRRCVCPMFAAKYCTMFAAKITTGVILSASLVFSLPYLAIYEFFPEGEIQCFISARGSRLAVLIVECIVVFFLPYVFLPVTLVIIVYTGRKGNSLEFRELDDRSAYAEQMRVLALTLFCIIEFSQFVSVFLDYNNVGPDLPVVYVVIELAFALSFTLQPIMCFIILKTLRDGFRSQLRNMSCCRRLYPSLLLDRDEEEVVQLTSIQEDPTSSSGPQVINLDIHTFIRLTVV